MYVFLCVTLFLLTLPSIILTDTKIKTSTLSQKLFFGYDYVVYFYYFSFTAGLFWKLIDFICFSIVTEKDRVARRCYDRR